MGGSLLLLTSYGTWAYSRWASTASHLHMLPEQRASGTTRSPSSNIQCRAITDQAFQGDRRGSTSVIGPDNSSMTTGPLPHDRRPTSWSLGRFAALRRVPNVASAASGCWLLRSSKVLGRGAPRRATTRPAWAGHFPSSRWWRAWTHYHRRPAQGSSRRIITGCVPLPLPDARLQTGGAKAEPTPPLSLYIKAFCLSIPFKRQLHSTTTGQATSCWALSRVRAAHYIFEQRGLHTSPGFNLRACDDLLALGILGYTVCGI